MTSDGMPRGRWRARVATVLLCLGFLSISESNAARSFSWDEGVYLESARLVAHGHPLFREVFSSQPPVFLETLSGAFRLFREDGVIAARVALVFAVVALLSTALVAGRLLGLWAPPLAVLAMWSKTFLDESVNVHAEMPALALGLLAVALLVIPRRDRVLPTALSGAFFALAVLSKLWIVPYALACAGFLALGPPEDQAFRLGSGSLKRGARRFAFFALGGALVFAAVLLRYDLGSLYAQVIQFHLAAAERGKDLLPRTGADVLFRFGVHNVSLGLLAIVGVFALVRKDPSVALILLAWALASAAFVLWHEPSFDRHALLVAPPLAILGVAGVSPLLGAGGLRRSAVLAAVVLLLLLRPSVGARLVRGRVFSRSEVVWTVPLASAMSSEDTQDPEEDEAVQLILDLTRPEDLVVADAPLLTFRAGRDVPPPLVDVSGTRILSGDIDAQKAIRWSQGAKVVVLWGDRLNRLEGYRAWVQENYRRVARWPVSEGRRELYARD